MRRTTGVTGNYNVGTLRAQGFDWSGCYRVSRPLYFDYDWALTSTVLVSANTPELFEKNLTYIQNDQIPTPSRFRHTTSAISAQGTRLGGRAGSRRRC